MYVVILLVISVVSASPAKSILLQSTDLLPRKHNSKVKLARSSRSRNMHKRMAKMTALNFGVHMSQGSLKFNEGIHNRLGSNSILFHA